jgi:hypothetical protein
MPEARRNKCSLCYWSFGIGVMGHGPIAGTGVYRIFWCWGMGMEEQSNCMSMFLVTVTTFVT